ncbi:MAG TPA: efflux RND transporter periplasmic adaptor subunit [Acidobacteriota bacterium]|nr:efflux RND transporter periplasmic adaptor subunit [Acidobacteriota bacterium]
MRPGKPVFIGILVVLVGLVVWWALQPEERGNSIIVSGNIELTEVLLSFPLSGEIVELTVSEGDHIEAGAVIARLNNEALLRQREEALAVLTSARSRLQEQDRHIEFLREKLQGELQNQQAALEQAQAQLRQLESGSRPQEIEQAEAALERARAVFERAGGDWERAQQLFSQEDLSKADYDAARASFETARAALIEARQRLDLVREGPRQEEIELARARVAQARSGIRLAKSGRLEIERNLQVRATLAAEIERAQANLELVETRVQDCVLTAPISGVVLSKLREAGEVVTAGSSVISLGDLENPWLRGYINETDLGRIKLNAPARVTTDSYPDRVYSGHVSFISSEAEFTPRQIQTQEQRVRLVYRIKIVLKNPNQELKLNMPADAEILLDEEVTS